MRKSFTIAGILEVIPEDFVRTSMSSGTIHLYEFGPYRLDVQRRVLLRSDRIVPLAPKTFDLLLVLVQSEGCALSKHTLMTALWHDTVVEEANLSFQVATLRKALNGEARWIETIPKHGYRFSANVQTITRGSAAVEEAAPPSQTARQIANPIPASGIVAAPMSDPISKRSLRPRIGGGVVLILTAVLALWLAVRTRDQPAPTMRESQLTAYEGFEAEPAFSPDGNHVVFTWAPGGANSDIWVRLIGAGQPVPLTNTPEREFSPAWSPDGRWIAFLRGELLNASLFVMPSIGGTERKIAGSGPGGVIGGTVRWSLDGKCLLVSGTTEKDDRIGLLLIDFNSGEKRRLTTAPAPRSDLGGSFSPDGRQIGFLRRHNQNLQGDIYLLNIDARLRAVGEPKRLETGGLQMGPPVWTSDGKEVVFRSTRAGRGGLWRVSVAGGTPVRIAVAGNDASDPAIAGTRLTYVQQVSDKNIWAIPTSGTGEAARLVASTLDEGAPQYSPDGGRIAFCSDQSGSQEIWVARSDGSRQSQLTSFGSGQSCTPRWSPNSRQLVFDSNAEAAQFDIYTINADGGQPRKLTDDPGTDAIGSFSGDGKWIYFMSDRRGRNEIWKMPAAGGQPLPVTTNGGVAAFEKGETLFFTKDGDRALWQMPAAGGPESKVLENVLQRNFVPTADGIYFVQRTEEGYSFQFLNLATRQVRAFGSTLRQVGNVVTVSADGRWFAYAQQDHGGSDIVLVDNFR